MEMVRNVNGRGRKKGRMEASVLGGTARETGREGEVGRDPVVILEDAYRHPRGFAAAH